MISNVIRIQILLFSIVNGWNAFKIDIDTILMPTEVNLICILLLHLNVISS